MEATRRNHRKRKIANQNCMCGVKKRKIIVNERKNLSSIIRLFPTKAKTGSFLRKFIIRFCLLAL